MKTVIMAGGKGTRISSVASDIPKPMIRICGKPVLEHEIECLRGQGFTDLVVTVSHLGAVIMDYFGDGSGVSPATGRPFGVRIEYFQEEQPLGNAGALFRMRDRLAEDFLLLNADSVFDVDFRRFVAFHRERGGLATLFAHPNSHPYDSSLIVSDSGGRASRWLTKGGPRPEYCRNRVNAGLHVLSPRIFDFLDIDGDAIGIADAGGKVAKIDLDSQVLRPLVEAGKVFCYESPEYVKDMGTPERYVAVCRDYASGTVRARNLRNRQKAVFLDRDGTINEYRGFIRSAGDFELLPGAAEAVRMINDSGYLAVVVTNQPVIARGEVTAEELGVIHDKMETLLGREGAYLDGIRFCPHHPDSGFEGEVAELKTECGCRKPKPGMLLDVAEDWNIDLASSWMVGDGERDILAGRAVGCRTVLIGGGDYGQDGTADSLLEAVKLILEREEHG